MVATENAQSLAEFREAAAATIDRVHRTGEPEVITVDGEVRAVLVSPAVYAEMAAEVQRSRDVAMMRRAIQEIADGKGLDARTMFDELQAELLAIKASQEVGAAT